MVDELTPDDLRAAGNHVERMLAPAVDADWQVLAGTLDWTVRETLEHAAGAVVAYAVHLGSRSTSFLGFRIRAYEDAENERILSSVGAAARLLANVVEAADPGVRAYHPMGMADATGFLAMACDEIVVHGWDAASGLGIPYEPPDAVLVEKVVQRLFPWTPAGVEPWRQLLWANGRASISGCADIEPDWGWHCAPLSEWDGVTRGRARQSAYNWDEMSQRWVPVDD